MTRERDDQRDRRPSGRFGYTAALAAAFGAGAGLASVVILATDRASEPAPPVPGLSADVPGEPPFFTVGKRTRGPLTLEELQIHIPGRIDGKLTPAQRACFLQKVGELAEKAGDPEALDPADVAFLPTDGSWDDLTFYGRRSLLAQAVVSRAVTLCF